MINEYLKYIIKDILNEEAQISSVSNAIRKRYEAEIYYYDPTDPKGSGKRIIQPVAYGLSKAGNMVLRAFQPYGDTKTKIPHWKLFRLDKIRNWKTLKNRIFKEPPGQFSAEGEYNPNGDKSMSQVYLNANFKRSEDFYQGKRGQGLMRYNKERNAQKSEKEPLYNLKRNIEKSITDPEVLKRIDKYKSNAAKKYVSNDDYINDLKKVNNDVSTNQSTEPIKKQELMINNDTYDNKNYDEINRMGPINKKKEENSYE